jgi:hypothetical protein
MYFGKGSDFPNQKKSNQHLNFEIQARCDFTLFLDPIRKNNDDEGR